MTSTAALKHEGAGSVTAKINKAFFHACKNGQLDTARRLHADVRRVDVHANDDAAFLATCKNGHLEVARWLHEDVGGVDVHVYVDAPFRKACKNGHREVALWLDSDEVWWCSGARPEKPAQCVAYVQGLRWSEMRRQWIGMVACFARQLCVGSGETGGR